MWHKKNLSVGLCVLAILFTACAQYPVINQSQLAITKELNNNDKIGLTATDLQTRAQQLKGFQSGDLIFKSSSSVYWILPDLDKMNLDLIAHEEQFSSSEYQARLDRVSRLHEEYLVFAVHLIMPFYSGWHQRQLYDYLENNLVITLENGNGGRVNPETEIYQTNERFINSNRTNETLEVLVSLRCIFKKNYNEQSFISAKTRKLTLKVRLRKNPPFRIGFFDEKYYQGFVWKLK